MIPELGLVHVAEVIQGESFPNLHSIHGSKYREPEHWLKSIDWMRRFPTKYTVTSLGRPVYGEAAVAEVLTRYRDGIQYVFDQTIRYMNKGYLPDELVQVVQQPENLTQHPWLGGFYGRVKHSVRQIYGGQTRWFEGDPTFLDPLSKKAVSERYVALMGRRDAIFAEATTATDTSDNQWSAELLLHIIRLNLKDMEAQLLNARSLGEIGFSLTNNNWRNWYMTSALKLEGTLGHDKAIDLQAPDLVKVSSLSAILESLHFRADGERIARDGVEPTMGVTFTEVDLDFALALRNGVMEFSERRPQDPDVQIDLTSAAFGGILSAKPEGDGHRQ